MMPPVELLFGPQRRRWLLATVLLLTFFSSWSSVLRLRELVDAGDVDAAAEGESLLTLAERNMLEHLPQRAGEAPRLPARPPRLHHVAARSRPQLPASTKASSLHWASWGSGRRTFTNRCLQGAREG